MSPEVSNLLEKELHMADQNIYNIPDMKTFYKKDPVAPYATTTLINGGNVSNRPMEHMFRPIPQNSHSGGSGDSCCKLINLNRYYKLILKSLTECKFYCSFALVLVNSYTQSCV